MIQEAYELRIERAGDVIGQAGHIVIGAGAGLSTAAGLDYRGERFTGPFRPFIEKYGMKDMYSSSFYPFASQEEKWAYWALHISLNRYEAQALPLYSRLLEFLKAKNHFIITTNVESQFEKAGFDKSSIFEVQGNYAFLQCETACHDTLYYNEQTVAEMLAETKDCRIPARLVPKCPVCGGNMEVNLRKDQYFVQDKNWHLFQNRYNEFLSTALKEKMVLLELGAGFNTPGIIRFPFEQMTFRNSEVTLIRLNKHEPEGAPENRIATIAFQEDMDMVLHDLIHVLKIHTSYPEGNTTAGTGSQP